MPVRVQEKTYNDINMPSSLNISARYAMESFFPTVPLRELDFTSIWGWQEGEVVLSVEGNIMSDSNPAAALEIEVRFLGIYLIQKIVFTVGRSIRKVSWGFPDLVESPNDDEEWPATINDPEVADDIRKIVHTQYTELFPRIKYEIWSGLHRPEFEFMHAIGFMFPQYHLFHKKSFASLRLQDSGNRFKSQVTYDPLLTGVGKPL